MAQNRSLAGLRIRERRKAMRLTQSDLAHRIGISPSYLNLIEHNRRPIGGKVLNDLARELELPPADLSHKAELSLVGELREAAADMPGSTAETTATQEFISRFPGWARLLSAVTRQAKEQRAQINAMSDRLTHDPVLQEQMHEMLSNITAIRSTADLLTSVEDIPSLQRKRFYETIHSESRRLSDVARALTQYFDAATEQDTQATTPIDEVERFWENRMHGISEMEYAVDLNNDITQVIDKIIASASELASIDAQTRIRAQLLDYAQDVKRMPLNDFLLACTLHKFDIFTIAREFGVTIPVVLRRLARHQQKENMPNFGLLMLSASGHRILAKPLPGFPLPRGTAPCPLWPIFATTSHPGRAISRKVRMPGGTEFQTISLSEMEPLADFEALPRAQLFMLFVSMEQATGTQLEASMTHRVDEIGTHCRICPRTGCAARLETSVLPTRV